jgi:uncharacterized protein YoxC
MTPPSPQFLAQATAPTRHLRISSYRVAKKLGHGSGWDYPRDDPRGWVPQEHRPPEVAGRVYYEPSGHAFEGEIAERNASTERGVAVVSPGEFAATVVSMAFAMLVVGLLFLVGSAMRTLASVRGAVDDVRRTAVPLITDVHTAVRQANGDLVQVEAILERTESIQGTVDSASRLALAAFATPVVKLAAISSGLSKVVRRLTGRA